MRLSAPELSRVGHFVAAFDNEPASCNVMRGTYPDAHMVFVETGHTPGALVLDDGAHDLRDFRLE